MYEFILSPLVIIALSLLIVISPWYVTRFVVDYMDGHIKSKSNWLLIIPLTTFFGGYWLLFVFLD